MRSAGPAMRENFATSRPARSPASDMSASTARAATRPSTLNTTNKYAESRTTRIEGRSPRTRRRSMKNTKPTLERFAMLLPGLEHARDNIDNLIEITVAHHVAAAHVGTRRHLLREPPATAE